MHPHHRNPPQCELKESKISVEPPKKQNAESREKSSGQNEHSRVNESISGKEKISIPVNGRTNSPVHREKSNTGVS